VLSPPDHDERAVALITAFVGGGIGGLVELGIPLKPTWPSRATSDALSLRHMWVMPSMAPGRVSKPRS
jgi:hypothetical protein